MSYTPNGYNPVHNTLNAASQGQIAMPCFPNPMPKTPNLPHQVRIAMLSILNNILDDEPASNMPDAGNQGQTAIPYIQTDHKLVNNAPDVDNQGQTAIPSIPSDHKPVPGTSDSANQGQTVMSFISSGHNSVLKTADAASQREAAMPCEMTQVPTPLTQETSATDISK